MIRAWRILCVGAGCVFTCAPLFGLQIGEGDALQRLQQELEAERTALEELRGRITAEENEAKAQRSALARQLLDTQLELEREEARIAELQSEHDASSQRLRGLLPDLRGSLTAADTAAERLQIYLLEIPGWSERAERLRELEAQLRSSLARVPSPGEAALLEQPGLDLDSTSWEELLRTYADALEQASRLSVEPATLWTARGVEEDVDLLRVGHVRFAYRTRDGDRLALALSSPRDASGYRWSEGLPDEARTGLEEAFDRLSAPPSEGGWVDVPFDPKGELRAEAAQERNLLDKLRGGGALMVPLGLVALAALVLIVERIFALYLANARAGKVARRVLALCREGRVQDARTMLESTGGTVARTLEACLNRVDLGQEAMEDGIEEQLLHELPKLQRFLRALALLAAVAPLLGLLGTVTGIIQTFGVIRVLGTTDPTFMADGISVALVTTAAGLSIAVPVLLAQGLLRGRGDRILSDAERYSASLLVLLNHGPGQAGDVDG